MRRRLGQLSKRRGRPWQPGNSCRENRGTSAAASFCAIEEFRPAGSMFWSRGVLVPMRVYIALFCLVAFAVSHALAFGPDNAWTRGGLPLSANAYVAPEPHLTPNAMAAMQVDTDDAPGWQSEIRFGGTTFWQRGNTTGEGGLYVTGQVLFDSPVPEFDKWYLDIPLRPRPHVGASISTQGGSSQFYAGVTWTVPLPSIVFFEASFGGTVHDAALTNAPIAVGCLLLFRESIGLGLELGSHWRVIGGIDHSSHAGLCGNDNDGLTHIGGSIGYRF
jgi:lipid A 3-O-deacylase